MSNPNNINSASVVLVHGFGFNSFVWEPVARKLADNYTIHPFTLNGYGAEAPPGGVSDTARLAAHEDAHWVGWSMGGLVALSAIQDGARPRSLSLLASLPCMVGREDWPCAIQPKAFAGFRKRVLQDPAAGMRHFAGLVTHGDEGAEQILAQLHAVPVMDARILRDGLDRLEQDDLRATWAQCHVPQHGILAQHDALVPARAVDCLAALCPEAPVTLMEKAGHALLLSQPEPCAQTLQAFWQTVP